MSTFHDFNPTPYTRLSQPAALTRPTCGRDGAVHCDEVGAIRWPSCATTALLAYAEREAGTRRHGAVPSPVRVELKIAKASI